MHLATLLLSTLNILVFSECLVCDSPSYLHKTSGDVMISAVIGTHSGEDCSIPEINGLQLVQSIITAIKAVNVNNLLPGLSLGLSVYDSCSKEDMAQKAIVSALVDVECNNEFSLGVIIEEGVEAQVRNLTVNLAVPIFIMSRTTSFSIEANIIAKTLYDLHWMPVNKLFSTEESLTTEFLKFVSSNRICVQKSLPLSEMTTIAATDTVVIFSTMAELNEALATSPANGQRLLYVPLDGLYQDLLDFKFSNVMILLPASLENPILLNPFNTTEKPLVNSIYLKTKSQTNLLQVQTAMDIMQLVGALKSHIKRHCRTAAIWSLCPNLPKFPFHNKSSKILSNFDEIRTHLKFLRVNIDDFESAVLIQQASEVKRLGALKLTPNGLMLDAEINITEELSVCRMRPTNESDGLNCNECKNFDFLYEGYFQKRQDIFEIIDIKQDAWVAALLSISAVGVLCCMAIAVFIVVRICKKDMLEGNPGFSFLLLLSIMLMYISILPYSFEVVEDNQHYGGIFCGLKIFGTSLSYSLVFSIMLARSFMLASCDEDGGFMSHVNGYLQTVLCFFIAVVQIALTLQFWAINWLLLSQQQCVAMSRGYLFLFLLGYDVFLLILLLCVSPLIIRSKRNYHEGSYFAVSTYICLVVWISWSTGYMIFPQWEDVFVCCGLVATATIILVSVFIPRTYLMLTGIVRDHIVSTLPSLNHTTTTTSIVDMNYRSTHALYDSVTLPRGNMNANYYAERPTTPSTSKIEDDRIENNYERSPSPRNITRF